MNRHLKVACACCAAALLLLVLAVAAAHAAPAGGAAGPTTLPRSLTGSGQVQSVYCAGPVCCGSLVVRYQGYRYTAEYCRWFRPLRNGDSVSTTVYLQRVSR